MSVSHYTATEAFSAISQGEECRVWSSCSEVTMIYCSIALPLFNPTRSFIHILELFEECGYAPNPDALKIKSDSEYQCESSISKSTSSQNNRRTRESLHSNENDFYNETRHDLDNFGNAQNTINSSQSPIRVR